MSTDIAESLPKRKFAPAPMVAKGAKGKGKSESPAGQPLYEKSSASLST